MFLERDTDALMLRQNERFQGTQHSLFVNGFDLLRHTLIVPGWISRGRPSRILTRMHQGNRSGLGAAEAIGRRFGGASNPAGPLEKHPTPQKVYSAAPPVQSIPLFFISPNSVNPNHFPVSPRRPAPGYLDTICYRFGKGALLPLPEEKGAFFHFPLRKRKKWS